MSTTVQIFSKDGRRLAETSRCGHVRKLLDEKKAVVVSKDPFSIRHLYDNEDKDLGGGKHA